MPGAAVKRMVPSALPAARADGLPSARIRPRSMMITWSARRSASANSWVVRITQMPRSRWAAMIERTARRPSGSTPAVGSSRKSTSGLPTSARARARRCCSPPESRRHGVRRTAPSPTSSMSISGSSGLS